MEEVCNTDACPIINEKVVATCNKTADIVFLIDGSGSLGADAFADELTFASNFAKGFEKQDTTNFSVIVFSGPYTWGDYYYCSGTNDLSKEVLKHRCGLEIVQHFSDALTTQTTLAGISYPGGTTFTSGALLLAIAELGFARSGAEKIAILLTDGKPIDKWETKRKARELKEEKYRLVVVPIEGLGINEKDVEYLKEDVSSLNHDDNTLILEDWHELAEIAEASTLVEDVCR
jgi:hypothetical protein